MPKELTPQEARARTKLSQEAVARLAGLSVATISRAERCKRFSKWKHVASAHRKALGL